MTLIHKQEVLLTRDGGKLDIEECAISVLCIFPFFVRDKFLLFVTCKTVWNSRDFPFVFVSFFFFFWILDFAQSVLHNITTAIRRERKKKSIERSVNLFYFFFSLSLIHSQVQQDSPGQEGALSSTSDSNGWDRRQKPSFCFLICCVPCSLILALVHIHREK